MATPGIYKNFEAEGEIGPYVIVTHGTTDYAVKATAAGNRILGFALVSGASGDIIPYQYSLGTLAVAAAG